MTVIFPHKSTRNILEICHLETFVVGSQKTQQVCT